MDKSIYSILKRLDDFIAKHPERCAFAPGVSPSKIKKIEEQLNIHLPNEYKLFLEHYNGGYICKPEMIDYLTEENELVAEDWESNYILSLENMEAEYTRLSEMNWKLDQDYEGAYPFIPVCGTPNSEILIVIDRKDRKTPVFDAWHEAFPYEWGAVYNDFSELLNDLILTAGDINTMAQNNDITAESYIMHYKETDNFQAEQFFRKGIDNMISLDYDKAIPDFQQALSLCSHRSDYYFFLSRAFYMKRDFRSALLAIENALKIIPFNPEYLFFKAEILAVMDRVRETNQLLEKIDTLIIKDAEYYLGKGRLYILMKQKKMALDCFINGNTLDPENIEILNELATINFELGYTDEAEKFALATVNIDKGNILAYYTLFAIYENKKDILKMEEISKIITDLLSLE